MKKDVNPRLDIDIIDVARRFSSMNLSPDDQAIAESILQLIRAGDFRAAKTLGDRFARPEFGSLLSYAARKQFTALVLKVPFPGNDRGRRQAAQDSFKDSERRCGRANRRLRFYSEHVDRLSPAVRVVLSRAREEIRKIMGPCSWKTLDRVFSLARPGGGVAIGTRNRQMVSVPFKLGETDLCCTSAALPYARRLVEGSQAWLRLHCNPNWAERTYNVHYVIANSSRISYVPKDARTMRTIAVEPHINVMLQLGVHEHLAHRLAKAGNDINDQSRNQNLAREGSLTGDLVTLDLSSASDTVCLELVRWLIPSDWFALLSDLRCESAWDREMGTIELEKFSSMGNGYTFVLETLLFLGLSRACNSLTGGEVASCYGDDIIISARSALLLTEVLKFCGFKLNGEKSFYHGPFRESCGADWYHGIRVTPVYLRKHQLRATDAYNLINTSPKHFRWHEIRELLLQEIGRKGRVFYVFEQEDPSIGVFSSFEYLKGRGALRWEPGLQTWTCLGVRFVSYSPRCNPRWSYTAALFGGRGSRYALKGRGSFRTCAVTPGIYREGEVG